MYEQNPHITIDDKVAKDTKRAFDFLKKAFKNTDHPHLKRYAVIDLSVIAISLLRVYDLSNYAEKFGEAFLKFTSERISDADVPRRSWNRICFKPYNIALVQHLFQHSNAAVIQRYIRHRTNRKRASDCKTFVIRHLEIHSVRQAEQLR